MDYNSLVKLGKLAVNAQPTAATAYSFGDESFTYSQVVDAFRDELRELTNTPAKYRENKNMVFSLIEEIFDDVLPKKVLEQYGDFAEIKTFAQGDKPVFKQRITAASKRRAMSFVTKVGLAGIYEVFKLDGKSFEVPTSAFGGAAQIGFEEFLDGRVEMADVLNIVLEGIDRCMYLEVEKALQATVNTLQTANKHTEAGFNEAQMDRLLQIGDSYGNSVIYCTFEFAATMIPSAGWISDDMKDRMWNNGYLGNYKGHRVVILNQSFEDERNTTKVIDPSYAWIIPTGSSNDKPVKIALEGQTIVDEYTNKDRSKEIQIYKKMGVSTIITNNICVYRNTNLTK